MTIIPKQTVAQMRSAKAKITMLLLLSMAAVALALLTSRTIQADNDRHGNSDCGEDSNALVGTWLVQTSLDPATVPPNSFLNITGVETFNAGGGYLESNNGPAAGGPGGQGNWARTGHNEFAVTELRLGFNAANVYTGINKIRRTLTLSKGGDEYSGIVQVDIFLPNGTLLSTHPAGTFHGTRVPIEPLN